MKPFTIKSLVLLLSLMLELELSFCDIIIPSRNARQTYNLPQLVQDVVINLNAGETIDEIKNNFDDDNRNWNSPVNNLLDLELSHLSILNNSMNKSCLRDLLYIAQNLKTKDVLNSWALQILDSNGKPESGFLEGNLKWLGDFDECRRIHAPKKNNSIFGGFQGQYCSLELALGNSTMMGIMIGICTPDSCDSSELLYSYMKFLNITRKIPFFNKLDALKPTSVVCKPNTRKLTKAAIATICVLSVFVALAMLGSVVTVVKYVLATNKQKMSLKEGNGVINYDSEKPFQNESDDILLITEGSRTTLSIFIEKSDAILNCFCLFTNGSKLLNTDATEGQLLCLHGIRFLSMSWVIVCHTYAFSFTAVRNMRTVLSDIDNLPFQVILNGFFSVDSFFVLSAFLMAYLYLQEAAKKKGNIPWFYFYVHRYLRLTPVYMLVIGFFATLYPYLGSGPLWPDYDIEPLCQKSWWWNILYINNFQSATEMCMAWSWYLANDMQFFIISPLFLITLWRWPKFGYSVLALFLIGSCTSAFVISYYYKLFSGMGNLNNITAPEDFLTQWLSYFNKLYTKPYTRIGPYLVGIALGSFLFRRKAANKPKFNHMALFLGWTIASVVALACVYGQYHKKLDVVSAAFYNSLSHTAYGASLCWVIYVCLSGQGGVVNKILSYKLFIPLSRLTYCAYLIHPMVLTGYFGIQRASFEFSHATIVVLFLGMLMVSYALSFVASLLFESPIIRLEKFIRTQFSADSNRS